MLINKYNTSILQVFGTKYFYTRLELRYFDQTGKNTNIRQCTFKWNFWNVMIFIQEWILVEMILFSGCIIFFLLYRVAVP